MKKGHSFARFLVLALIVVVICVVMVMPVHAWKVKTHVYSANLVIKEIRANNGYVEIEPFGKFKVVPEYWDAIRSCPEYYRAGAMGPDVFPDIIVGQTVLHPGSDIFSSGDLIEFLWDAAESLPENQTKNPKDPASKYLRINTRKEAIAFVLGCVGHAAGDFFGHSYINYWAGGAWPDIMDGISASELAIITRHNVVEAYIDEKIPAKYQSAAYNSIKIPQQFVFDNLVATGTVNMDVLANDSRTVVKNGMSKIPAHLDLFFDIRDDLRDAIIEIDKRMGGDAVDVITSVISLEFAQKAYMKAWIEDIDSGLGDWVACNEKAAQKMVSGGGMSGYKEELEKWADKHLLSMLGMPDVAVDIINAIGDIEDFVSGLISDDLQKAIDEMQFNFVNFIFKNAFNLDLKKLIEISTQPTTALNRRELFPEGSQAKLDKEMGNFSTSTNSLDQTFVPFSNTLVLMKLALIDKSEYDELRKIAGSKDSYELDYYTTTLTQFVGSMDFGYKWEPNPHLGNFLFWQGADDRNKISKVIFNLNGTTPRPVFSNMTKGPISIVPGTRTQGSVPDISVTYSNAPDQVNAVIGLYPADNFNSGAESWKYIARKTSGTYTVTTPFKGGKYHFRMYDNEGLLLAVSDTIEITERDPGAPYFDKIPTKALNPGEMFSFSFVNTQKKAGFYALYKEGEKDPEKPFSKKRTLNGKTIFYDISEPAPDNPGRYQYRAYDSNNVLLAESSILTVAGEEVPVDENSTTNPDNSRNEDAAKPGEGGKEDTSKNQASSVLTLRATPGPGYVKLDWNSLNDPKGVIGYYLYKSTRSGGQTSTPETDFWIAENTYTDIKIEGGKTYYYILKPVYKDRSIGEASNEVSAAPEKEYGVIVLTLGKPHMTVNGVSREIDPGANTVPELMQGRTCLPIRAVAEAMGSTVKWDDAEKKVTLIRGDITVELWIGKKTVRVNGKDQSIDVAPYTSKTGRTMIPLRFAGESLGGVITWDNETKTATIVYGEPASSKVNLPDPEDSTNTGGSQQTEVQAPQNGWAGTWFTDFGRMDITVNGSNASGTYGESKHTIKGTISGRRFSGTYKEGGNTGDFEFMLSEDGSSFEGTYDNGENEWCGERERDEHSSYLKQITVNWSGTWETDFGPAVFEQKGNKVTGTIGEENILIIECTAENNKLTGFLYENKGTRNEIKNRVELYMFEAQKDFVGWYGDDQTPKQDWYEWGGVRAE